MIKVLYSGKKLRVRRRDTILNPPEGVKYVTQVPVKDMPADIKLSYQKKQFSFAEKILKIIEIFQLPNVKKISDKDLEGIDLVHTPGHLLRNDFPYVIEIDNVSCLAFYRLNILRGFLGKKIIKRFLKSKNCKKLICISEASRKSVQNEFKDEEISKKCAVVYPHATKKKRTVRKNKSLNFLFSYFYVKGGKEVVNVFNGICANNKNVKLKIITKKEHISSGLIKNAHPNIEFIQANFTKEEIFKKYYAKADVFILPTFQDSFGIVFLEALSFGLPIITTNMFAVPEMVKNNFNGLVLQSPIKYFNSDFTPNKQFWGKDIASIVKDKDLRGFEGKLMLAVEKLIKKPNLIKRMSKNSEKLFNEKFSETKRKIQLKKIYEGAV